MEFIHTSIASVILVRPQVYGDARGFFMETYQARRFSEAGIPDTFVQDNHSGSRQNILRGLHYQIHQAQGKLVRVVSGEIFDVAVDLRRSSPTFGKWEGHRLSAANHEQMWIPVGFAHGFYVLSEWAEVVYKTTDYYAPEWERTLLWNDPQLGINWPLIAGEIPQLSEKDKSGALFKDAEVFD
ncbi:MAG: dTDP-4-dehydrorhamnose 3,5-epimerase [Anaerolineales bacterium]